MKYLGLLVTIIIFLTACGDRKYYKSSYYLASNIVKMDNKLYFQQYETNNNLIYKADESAFYQFTDLNKNFLYEFNDINKTWVNIALKKDNNITILNDYNKTVITQLYKPFDIQVKDNIIEVDVDKHVVFSNHQAIVKNIDTNNTLISYDLPSAEEIASNLSLPIINSIDLVEYLPFIENQYEWNRERYIVFIGSNKVSGRGGISDRYTGYFIFMYWNNSNWEYTLVDTKYDYPAQINGNIGHYSHLSLDGKVNLSIGDFDSIRLHDISYFVLEDNKIKIKKLFRDVYGLEFKATIDNIYSFGSKEIYNGNFGKFTFDKKGNMHLFYNKKEEIISENYDCFWYAYFEKENLTVPLYEQKIPWK